MRTTLGVSTFALIALLASGEALACDCSCYSAHGNGQAIAKVMDGVGQCLVVSNENYGYCCEDPRNYWNLEDSFKSSTNQPNEQDGDTGTTN